MYLYIIYIYIMYNLSIYLYIIVIGREPILYFLTVAVAPSSGVALDPLKLDAGRQEKLVRSDPPSLVLSPSSGCGVKKVSVVNMKASQYVPIHSKQIRGLSFNRQNDSLLLSAALDNTIKLTRYTHTRTSNRTVFLSVHFNL